MMNRVRIEINAAKYVVSTPEEESYVKALAKELDGQVRALLEANGKMTQSDALVLCALSALDEYRKSEENANHMRDRLTEYVKDESKARLELDEAKREIERLTRRLELLGQTQLG